MKSLFLYYIKIDLDRAALCWRMLVGVLAWVEVSGRKFIASGRVQFELLTIRSSQVVSLRVEVQRPSQGQGSDNLRVWKYEGNSFICKASQDLLCSTDWELSELFILKTFFHLVY